MTHRVSRLFCLSILQVVLVQGVVSAAGLRGAVTDPDGRPTPGARVVVSSARQGSITLDVAADGSFAATGLPDGEYVVRAVLDGFAADPATIRLSGEATTEVPLRLRVAAVAESMVVSAAHTDLPLSEAASTISVISGTEVATRQLRAVGDALRFVPGLSVSQNGGFGNLSSLFTRGGESDFTLVLIDGMRANAFGGGLDLAQIPLVDVERVEVVRGPQSAVFGAEALGGVVQIVTTQRQKNRGDLTLEGGSLGTMRVRGGAGGTHRGLSYHLAMEHGRSDGFTGTAPATGTTVSNDDGQATHVGFGAGWRATGGAAITGRAQLSSTERGFPGPFGSNPIGVYTAIDTVSRSENSRQQASAEWTQPWGASARLRQRTHVSVNDFDSTYRSQFGTSLAGSRRISVRSQTDATLSSKASLSGGIDIQRERADSTYVTGTTGDRIPVDRWLGGYFAEVRLAPSNRWSVAGGVRLERISRDALDADPFAFQPRPAFAQDTVNSVNPRLSVAYLAHGAGTPTTTRLHANVGTGIRPPDAFEIAFTDNPGLRPERSRSVDVGVQQTFASGAVSAEATAFVNSYDDLIIAVGRSFQNASRYRTDNISNARARGLELGLGARPMARVGLRASYTFLATEILSVDGAAGQVPSPYAVGESLIRRPRHQGSVSATFTDRRLTAYVDGVMRGSVRDVEPSYGAFGGVYTADGYGSINAGATVRVARLLDVFGRVENLGGRRYEEAFGFPSPGRTALAGVRVATSR